MSHRGTKALKAQQEKNRVRRERKDNKKEEWPAVPVTLHVDLHDGGTLSLIKNYPGSTTPGSVEVVFKWGKLSLQGRMNAEDGYRVASLLRESPNNGR